MAASLTIVLVEDNDDLRELTAEGLREAGHQVVALSCAEELEEAAKALPADLFLIDLNLPGEDGFSLAQRLRKAHPQVWIAIISARSDVQDKVNSYDCGADLYLAKPVPFEELLAVINSFARRGLSHSHPSVEKPGGFVLQQRALRGPSGEVRLTAAEEMLLTAFVRAPSGRLEVWQIEQILGLDATLNNKANLEVRFTRLRNKLGEAGCDRHALESVRGVGYQLSLALQVMGSPREILQMIS
jgi:DNA-binding response OmpR family regulator